MSMMKAYKSLGRWASMSGLLLAGLLLTGCSMFSSHSKYATVSNGNASAAATNAAPAAVLDVLKPTDAITIAYADTPTPIPTFDGRIKEDGTITLIQNQKFQAAGKTKGQLEDEIHERYVPRFFQNMTVTITETANMRFYYVGGDVKAPGRQVYLSRITVLKAIQSAGDFTDFARKRSVLLTREDGHKFTVNCVKARTNPALDLEVYPGDTIFVPRTLLW